MWLLDARFRGNDNEKDGIERDMLYRPWRGSATIAMGGAPAYFDALR